MTMMTTWLIELYLNQIGDLKDRGLDARPERERIEEEFRKLLVQGRVKVCKFFQFLCIIFDGEIAVTAN